MDSTHPPVKVLLTDGLNQGLICAVEQVLFIHRLPSVSLLHLLSLPEHTIHKNIDVMTAQIWVIIIVKIKFITTSRVTPFPLCSYCHLIHLYCKNINYRSFKPKRLVYDLPLKDLPQRGVLDPLDAVNFTVGHRFLKQLLNHIIRLCRCGERY